MTAQEGCQPYTPATFTPQEILLVLISLRGWVDPRATVRSEGLRQWKVPMTPPGIEQATFRFVAQHLNYCATTVPVKLLITWRKSIRHGLRCENSNRFKCTGAETWQTAEHIAIQHITRHSSNYWKSECEGKCDPVVRFKFPLNTSEMWWCEFSPDDAHSHLHVVCQSIALAQL